MRALSRIVCYVAAMHSEQPESEFARILAGIQERTGLSHQRIADAAGVDRSQVWRWVRGGSNPGYEPVRKLAAWLIAERPEVADAAAALLPAAGYDIAPRTPVLNTTPEMEQAISAHLPGIMARLEVARADHPAERLTGEMLYPLSPKYAAIWDQLATLGNPPEGTARVMAIALSWETEEARAAASEGSAAGLMRRRETVPQ